MSRSDDKALGEHVTRIRPKLAALARRSGQAMFEADDLLQEVFRIGLEHELDWSVAQDGWLIVTAQNILRTAGRRSKCWRKYLELRAVELATTSSRLTGDVEFNELHDRIRSCVQCLPSTERIVVEKRFFNCSGEENKSVSTARTRFHRAKHRLRADVCLQRLNRDLGS